MKIITPILLVLTLIFSSCLSEQLDINQNPNQPADVPIQVMLPNIMVNLTDLHAG